MSEKTMMEKYVDPGNLVVTVFIKNVPLYNTLIYLGFTINIMTVPTIEKLQLENLQPTPTILGLVDKSRVNTTGILDDIIVTLDSWDYPMYLLVIQPNTTMDGHLVILGRPWLAKVDVFIGCRPEEMTISNGIAMKKLILYLPARPVMEESPGIRDPYE
jgi:hypothetical protein